MKFYLNLMAVFALCQMALAGRFNITCYYDTSSIQRGGFANFTENDLKTSLEYCTHVVYGYVGLKPDTFDLITLHPRQHLQFSQVKKLKNQYHHIKFLVSLGGGKDLKQTDKYIKLLEASAPKQQNFISSARTFLLKYNFDGLDLAYQFPRNKSHFSKVKKIFEKVQNAVTKNNVAKKLVGPKYSKKSQNYNAHKQQFTVLVNKLKNTLRRDRLMLTLTVLPHVNVSSYLNIPAIIGDFDFVNLGTFDYSTPERTPNKADYLAPLYTPPRRDNKHSVHSSIEYEVQKWLAQHVHRSKLNIGIAAFGRSWKMTKQLKSADMPIKSSLDGPALGGELTLTPGLLSWPEMCFKLSKMTKTRNKRYGNYAFRSAGVKGQEGLLITYEDKDSLAAKAEYVAKNSLGGVALFDLTLDDFRGKCKEGKYPALEAIKFKLY